MKTLKLVTGLALAALVLSSCRSNNAATQAKAPLPAPQTFSQPTVPAANPPLAPIPIAGMIQVTNGSTRLAEVATNSSQPDTPNPSELGGANRDPFAALPPGDLRVSPTVAAQFVATTPQPTVSKPQASKSQASAKLSFSQPMPLPKVQVKPTALSPQPVQAAILPVPAPITVLPSLPAAASPTETFQAAPPTLTNLADTVAITGVLQVGGKLTAIVQEPDASARYVQSGDYLANGKVLLKRITMSKNGQPTVILQQNGQEVLKTVGA
ncbi:MAG: hypothetical protein KME13_08490 [Myxacorys californica WJT36-NPBG1]|jgi:hypothetical protein|nr:hypothetical protein [Myxacorys californica WJT36-NPBG1]